MPTFEEYVDAIRPLWDSRWLTNMGSYHKQLEKELKKYLDVPELSLMVNGHMALELAIQAFFTDLFRIVLLPIPFTPLRILTSGRSSHRNKSTHSGERKSLKRSS